MSKPFSCYLAVILLASFGSETARSEIYVSNKVAPKLVVHANDAQGNALPVRKLQGPNTSESWKPGVALDQQADTNSHTNLPVSGLANSYTSSETLTH